MPMSAMSWPTYVSSEPRRLGAPHWIALKVSRAGGSAALGRSKRLRIDLRDKSSIPPILRGRVASRFRSRTSPRGASAPLPARGDARWVGTLLSLFRPCSSRDREQAYLTGAQALQHNKSHKRGHQANPCGPWDDTRSILHKIPEGLYSDTRRATDNRNLDDARERDEPERTRLNGDLARTHTRQDDE